jgi:hypothetical protein
MRGNLRFDDSGENREFNIRKKVAHRSYVLYAAIAKLHVSTTSAPVKFASTTIVSLARPVFLKNAKSFSVESLLKSPIFKACSEEMNARGRNASGAPGNNYLTI